MTSHVSLSYGGMGIPDNKRVAIVTGADGGIGRAVCAALAPVCTSLYSFGHRQHDVFRDTDPLGSHILVCCHASKPGASFQETIDIDLTGTYNVCMCVLPWMVERGFGRIVTFSSIRAHHPRANFAAYAAAKSGVEGLTRALAVEYGPKGILVNCVAPGAVLTPRTTANIARGVVNESELLAHTPTGRLTTPEEVARVVLWLCSEECHINGQTITVDGGWSISG